MKLETDLARIKEIARQKEDENWEFRSFLKFSADSEEGIDRIVHDLYRRISSEIDCKQCANCCRQLLPPIAAAKCGRKLRPVLSQKDIRTFAGGLGLEVMKFKEQYLVKDEEEPDKLLINRLPCPFLKDNLCLHYDCRPENCRSFPNLHKPDFTFRLFGVIENYSICPRVFNVYESLKNELWHGRR